MWTPESLKPTLRAFSKLRFSWGRLPRPLPPVGGDTPLTPNPVPLTLSFTPSLCSGAPLCSRAPLCSGAPAGSIFWQCHSENERHSPASKCPCSSSKVFSQLAYYSSLCTFYGWLRPLYTPADSTHSMVDPMDSMASSANHMVDSAHYIVDSTHYEVNSTHSRQKMANSALIETQFPTSWKSWFFT